MKSKEFSREQMQTLYQSIKEIFIDYREKLEQCKSKKDSLFLQLEELENYVAYLDTEVNKDSFVFSPRGIVSKNAYMQEEGKGLVIDTKHVEQKKEELIQLRSTYDTVVKDYQSLEYLVHIMEQNKNLLNDLQNVSSQSENDKNHALYSAMCSGNKMILSYINSELIDSLSYVSHTTKLISSYIQSDPMRAKIELDKMNDTINNLLSSIENIEITLTPYPYEVSSYQEISRLINTFCDIYPDSKLVLKMKKDILIDDYFIRIFLYLIIRDFLFLSCNKYPDLNLSVQVTNQDMAVQLVFTCIGNKLFKLFQTKEYSKYLISMIQLNDPDYKMDYDSEKDCSFLTIQFNK